MSLASVKMTALAAATALLLGGCATPEPIDDKQELRNRVLLSQRNCELTLPNCQLETAHNSKCSSAYCA